MKSMVYLEKINNKFLIPHTLRENILEFEYS